jgi:hypothetical protein
LVGLSLFVCMDMEIDNQHQHQHGASLWMTNVVWGFVPRQDDTCRKITSIESAVPCERMNARRRDTKLL